MTCTKWFEWLGITQLKHEISQQMWLCYMIVQWHRVLSKQKISKLKNIDQTMNISIHFLHWIVFMTTSFRFLLGLKGLKEYFNWDGLSKYLEKKVCYFIASLVCPQRLRLGYSGSGFRKWAKESKNFLEVSLAPDSASNWSWGCQDQMDAACWALGPKDNFFYFIFQHFTPWPIFFYPPNPFFWATEQSFITSTVRIFWATV